MPAIMLIADDNRSMLVAMVMHYDVTIIFFIPSPT